MELKKHFKLYKSGKQWISTAIITAGILFGTTMVSSVMADDSTMTDTLSAVSNINTSQTDGEAQNVNGIIGNTAEKLASTTNQTANVLDNSTVANESSPVNGWNSNHTEYYQNGQAANGYVQANDGNYYMFHNGVRQSGVQQWMGTYYYFDPTTYLRVDNDYREQIWQDGSRDWYMFGNNGQIVTGKYNWQGNVYYFDPSSYLKVVNDYRATESDGRGVLLGNDGIALSGLQQWMGSYYYFDPVTKLRVDNDYRATENDGRGVLLGSNGIALSGLQQWMGTYYYFDPVTKLRVDNDYREQIWQDGSHDWYMFGNNGQIVTGKYNWQGNVYYFDPSSYLKVVNDYRATEPDGRGVLLGNDGAALSGVQQWMGTYYYFDPVTKLRVDNAYVKSQWGLWYMFGSNGQIVTGPYNWQGSTYYFDPSSYLRVDNEWVNGMYYGSDGKLINPDDTFSGHVINWFRNHEGKLTYSMDGARDGSDGTADCSGAMTEALYEAGASKPTEVYDTESIPPYLLSNGYSLVYEGQDYYTPRFGDIIIWGEKNHTSGASGHIVIISNMSSNPNCISVNWLSRGKRGAAVSENNYSWYWNNHSRQYQQVFRPNDITRL